MPRTKAGAIEAVGYAAHDASGIYTKITFTRREVGDLDVSIRITYAGICHSDLHTAKNEWQGTKYPVVTGHEIVGIVTEVGSKVTKFKVDDVVGVGCLVNSCRDCRYCKANTEQYCPKTIMTYNSEDRDGTITKGGYSSHIVVDEAFVLHIPKGLDPAAAAPLLCAGITTYSPLRQFGLDKPGMKIGVNGLGGLGHMAVKFAVKMGCEVTVISTSESKREEAINKLGAAHFLISKDEEAIKAAAQTFDGIIDTVSAAHDILPLLSMIQTSGKLIVVGAPPTVYQVPPFVLLMRNLTVAGSLIGGLKETQEMLDFCAEHNVLCDIEIISADYINTAMERLLKSDVKYRFVIDVENTLKA